MKYTKNIKKTWTFLGACDIMTLVKGGVDQCLML